MLPEFRNVVGHFSLTALTGDKALIRGTLSTGRLTVLPACIAKVRDPTVSKLAHGGLIGEIRQQRVRKLNRRDRPSDSGSTKQRMDTEPRSG